MSDDRDELYEDIERRALFGLPAEDEAEEVDVVEALRADAGEPAVVAPVKDVTLGGYIEVHDRVPAFEGSDGQPYTVDVDVEETGDPARPYVGFLIFIRWAATGAGIMDHTESGDLTEGGSEAEARQAVLDLTLFEIKTELDTAIARRRAALEDD